MRVYVLRELHHLTDGSPTRRPGAGESPLLRVTRGPTAYHSPDCLTIKTIGFGYSPFGRLYLNAVTRLNGSAFVSQTPAWLNTTPQC
jgi:hypothetical protein